MVFRPKVSVITPTFNHARFLGACIRSVQRQTYGNWEHLIVDDGSTDQSQQIVERSSNSRTTYLSRTHEGINGLGRAYNAGLELATGELVAILEGDDCWPENKLELQIRSFATPEPILSWGRGRIINDNGAHLGTLRAFRRNHGSRMFRLEDLVPKMLLGNFLTPSSGVMVRRSSLEGIGGFQQPAGTPFVDYPTWLSLLAHMQEAERFVYLDEVLVEWRYHKGQVSANYPMMVKAWAQVSEGFASLFHATRPDLFPEGLMSCTALLSLCAGRRALSSHDWGGARKQAISCLKSESKLLASRAIATSISGAFHRDLFHVLFNAQRAIPELANMVNHRSRSAKAAKSRIA